MSLDAYKSPFDVNLSGRVQLSRQFTGFDGLTINDSVSLVGDLLLTSKKVEVTMQDSSVRLLDQLSVHKRILTVPATTDPAKIGLTLYLPYASLSGTYSLAQTVYRNGIANVVPGGGSGPGYADFIATNPDSQLPEELYDSTFLPIGVYTYQKAVAMRVLRGSFTLVEPAAPGGAYEISELSQGDTFLFSALPLHGDYDTRTYVTAYPGLKHVTTGELAEMEFVFVANAQSAQT